MRSVLLIIGLLSLQTTNPFSELGQLHSLKGWKQQDGIDYPQTAKGATVLARKTFFKPDFKLTIDALSFAQHTSLRQLIHERNRSRQGAAIPIPMAEFDKQDLHVHYVAQPSYLEIDVTSGRIWVQIGVSRGNKSKISVLNTREEIAQDIRKDAQTYRLLKSLLPDIKRLAKQADTAQ